MTTVRRLATHLTALGVAVQVVVTTSADAVEQGISFCPQIVHAFHAYKAGVVALQIAQRAGAPLFVTLTGTDLHEDLHHSERSHYVRQVLTHAFAIVVFSEAIAEELIATLPDLREKVRIIPQGVWFPPQEDWAVRAQCGIPSDAPVLLLPANIRKVKRPLLAVEGVRRLRQKGWDAHLLLMGEVLERDEGERVMAALQKEPWAHYLGSVPMERVVAVYRAADIVLNTSLHEGGMANALLEAMILERPVLAARVSGNTTAVRERETGLLFNDAAELAEQAERLLLDAALRQRLVRNAKQWVLHHCDPLREAQRYWQLYRKVAL